MRTVGHRKERPISLVASSELLAEGARFNDEIHRLPTGQTTRIRKGVYRFKTHEEANRQQLDALVENVAHAVAARRWWKSTAVRKDIDPGWFEESENIRVADAIIVDVMLNACGETYETLKKYADTVDLEGVPVRTLSLEGLLLTKQTKREKDIADRIVLEHAIESLRRLS